MVLSEDVGMDEVMRDVWRRSGLSCGESYVGRFRLNCGKRFGGWFGGR